MYILCLFFSALLPHRKPSHAPHTYSLTFQAGQGQQSLLYTGTNLDTGSISF